MDFILTVILLYQNHFVLFILMLFKFLTDCNVLILNNFKLMSSSVDDMNWNALEWDRAAEELTWERVFMHDITDLQTAPPPVPYL